MINWWRWKFLFTSKKHPNKHPNKLILVICIITQPSHSNLTSLRMPSLVILFHFEYLILSWFQSTNSKRISLMLSMTDSIINGRKYIELGYSGQTVRHRLLKLLIFYIKGLINIERIQKKQTHVKHMSSWMKTSSPKKV